MSRNKYTEIIEAARDRRTDGIALASAIVEAWGCDLSSRKLRVVIEDAVDVTEMDALALFVELARTNRIINLPTYECARPMTERSGEVLVSTNNRHGPVLNLSSNKAVFSAGILVKDANVVTTDQVGSYRTFMLTNLRGELDMHRWGTVEIITQDPAIPDMISLTRMVNPGRWASFYGRPYLAAKVLILHLTEKVANLQAQVASLKPKRVTSPYNFTTQVGDTKVVTVDAFEAVLDGFVMTGEFETYPNTPEGAEAAEGALKRAKKLLKLLKFLTRMTEKAFYDHAVLPQFGGTLSNVMNWVAGTVPGTPTVAPWKQSNWACGFKPTSRSKLPWARMEMLPGLHLRWRVWPSQEKVNNTYVT